MNYQVISIFKCRKKKEFILSKQLLRSGTAIGALVRESEQAENKKDFIHKLAIAQKEANETDYWLELFFQSDIIEINKILASIIITTKQKLSPK